MSDFLNMFPATDIQYVCADREAREPPVAGVPDAPEDFVSPTDQSQSRTERQTRASDEGTEIIADGAHQ
jgi:hypothetical protein